MSDQSDNNKPSDDSKKEEADPKKVSAQFNNHDIMVFFTTLRVAFDRGLVTADEAVNVGTTYQKVKKIMDQIKQSKKQ